jgi:putative oxidoreductase
MVEAPERRGEPRLVIAGLAPFYAKTSNFWYPFLRFVAGGLLIIPGWQHFENGAALFATTSLAKNGFPQALLLAYFIIFIEMIGGACIAMGFLTRLFAPACAILMALIAFGVQWPRGFGTPTMFFLLWGATFFAISLRGGGPYSLDRLIGREL